MQCLSLFCVLLTTFTLQLSASSTSTLVSHVEQSIKNAELGISKLSPEILSIDGMSSNKVRHLLNNLCSLKDTRYLEIGTWKGSTWVSALYGNNDSVLNAVAIDNWSEFGGPEKEFLNNCIRYLEGIQYQYYSADSFTLDTRVISEKINVYFYDGNHSQLSQERALTYYDSVLADEFILIVDDWNWHQVKQGTMQGIAKLQYQVVAAYELPARWNGDRENWWNGIYIAVIRKTQ